MASNLRQTSRSLVNRLTGEISQILSVPTKQIDISKPVSTLGLDSLMGYELIQSIEQRFNVTIPLVTFTQEPSLQQIAKLVTENIMQKNSE